MDPIQDAAADASQSPTQPTTNLAPPLPPPAGAEGRMPRASAAAASRNWAALTPGGRPRAGAAAPPSTEDGERPPTTGDGDAPAP
jgi:hypothetical protein